MKPRQFLLALALAASLAAAFWPRPQEEVVGAVAKQDRRVDKRSASTNARPNTGEAPQLGIMRGNLFPAQTWQPPPPARRMATLPPPPPVAPPLPFQYLGRWQEGGKDVLFLAQGNRVLHARVGDSLSGWHFDRAGDADLTFTWTALNMQQTLRIAP
jgi:hypothetical protein